MDTDALTKLGRHIEEEERRVAALRKIFEGARELGEEGERQLRSIVETNGSTNGNSSSPSQDEETEFTPPFRLTEERIDRPPRGRKALMLIMQERPGIWRLAELRAEMHARGWFTSSKGVEVGMHRLSKDGLVRRISKGRYLYQTEQEKEVVDESVTSAVA
jgi:hypothetical protein